MDTIFIKSENSRTFEYHVLEVKIADSTSRRKYRERQEEITQFCSINYTFSIFMLLSLIIMPYL